MSNNLKKEDYIATLKDLQNSAGWKIVTKVLNDNIEDVEQKLRGESKEQIEDIATLKQLQDKRNDRVQLRDLPENLIKEVEAGGSVPNFDPYQ